MLRVFFFLTLVIATTWPALAYDIEATGLELNQTIQNLDNDMPLVLGRRIVVRVHASELTGVPVNNVEARIDYSVSYTAEGGLGGGGFGGTFPTTADVLPGGADRIDFDGSFNFIVEPYIPDDIDKAIPASITVTVTVNHDNLGAETDATNNTISVTRPIFVADKLHIRYVPVHLHEPAPNGMTPVDPTDPVIEHYFPSQFFDNLMISATALRLHPVALDDAGFSIGWENTPVYPIDHNLGVEWNLHNGTDRTAINSQLKALRDLSGWPTSWIIYGMVDSQAAAGSFSGWANNGVAWGVMNGNTSGASPWRVYGGDTLAHEIGHRRGLAHMLCNGNEASGGGIDPDYPWPLDPPWSECSLADVDDDGYFGTDPYPEFFFDYTGTAVISNDPDIAQPNRGFPIMGYKSPRWVSPFEYCKLLPAYGVPCNLQWPDPPGPPSGITWGTGTGSDPGPSIGQLLGAAEHIWVGGVIDFDLDKVSALPSYSFGGTAVELDQDTLKGAVERRRDDATTGFDSGWTLDVEDTRGQVLYSQAVVTASEIGESCGQPHDHDHGPGHVHDDETLVALADVLPLPTGSARVVYRNRDGAIVERLELSANAPEVFFTALPSTNQPLQAGTTLQWYGRDRDGDALTYILRASADGGNTWNILALNTTDTVFTLGATALEALPGGATRLQVLVTDGARSGYAEAGSFAVANKAPNVAILSSSFEGSSLTLSGFAADLEDGTLTGYGLSWVSDLGGQLGTGTRLVVDDLTSGLHHITLTAKDSAGATASTTVKVRIP
ncbi:MAG: hypothetical protein AAGD38_08695 [Acidobacteriota bacterium]